MEAIDKPILLKPRTIIIALVALFSFTVPLLLSGALIYFEFRTMQTKITTNEQTQIKDNINTNIRLDKKTGRNTESIKELEKPNTDKNK